MVSAGSVLIEAFGLSSDSPFSRTISTALSRGNRAGSRDASIVSRPSFDKRDFTELATTSSGSRTRRLKVRGRLTPSFFHYVFSTDSQLISMLLNLDVFGLEATYIQLDLKFAFIRFLSHSFETLYDEDAAILSNA